MSPSTARTMAPASITSVVRRRSRTFSRTVVHMLRTAAALGSPGGHRGCRRRRRRLDHGCRGLLHGGGETGSGSTTLVEGGGGAGLGAGTDSDWASAGLGLRCGLARRSGSGLDTGSDSGSGTESRTGAGAGSDWRRLGLGCWRRRGGLRGGLRLADELLGGRGRGCSDGCGALDGGNRHVEPGLDALDPLQQSRFGVAGRRQQQPRAHHLEQQPRRGGARASRRVRRAPPRRSGSAWPCRPGPPDRASAPARRRARRRHRAQRRRAPPAARSGRGTARAGRWRTGAGRGRRR